MSKPSTAVEQAASTAVGSLYQPQPLDFDSDDITLPRIRIGQGLSGAVTDGAVKLGALYAATGQDDPDPEILVEPGAAPEEGFLFHVLDVKKGKSLNVGGDLETWDFYDPEAPPEAKTTWDFSIVLPEHKDGADVPFKFLLKGSSAGAAKLIYTTIIRNEGRGPRYLLAFRATSKVRVNKNNQKYGVAVVRQVEADAANVAIAEKLAIMIAGTQAEVQATGDKPAI